MAETICKRCGVTFRHPASQDRVYCGRECQRRASWQNPQAADAGIDPALYKAARAYEEGARRRGIHWELTYEECDRLFSSHCYLCGKEGPGGIDRLDSRKGYFPLNVHACCTTCNLLKGDLHLVEFLFRIRRIYEHTTAQGFYILLELWDRDG